jgi:hypothetical protein
MRNVAPQPEQISLRAAEAGTPSSGSNAAVQSGHVQTVPSRFRTVLFPTLY